MATHSRYSWQVRLWDPTRFCSRGCVQVQSIRVLLSGLVTLVLAGCATQGGGVIQTPPQPLAITRVTPPPPRHRTPRVLAEPRREIVTKWDRGNVGWTPASGISDRWKSIVIHHSGGNFGNAAHFDKYHRTVKKWNELGYHFVIGNGNGSVDGLIEVGPRWTKQKHGAHCKTGDNFYNDHGIGICLVGNFENTRPTGAQMQSLRRLVNFLTRETGILPSKIVSHGDVTGKTECPGRYFSLPSFRHSIDIYSAGVMR